MYKKLAVLYLGWFLLLIVVGFGSLNFSTYPGNGAKACNVKGYPPYFRWDSSWYMEIARHGYDFSYDKNSSIAYWPLFPLTIKAVHSLNVIPLGDISFFLNIVYSFLALYFIYKLARLDYSEKESFYVAVFWLLFPTAYFLISGYPDALFAFLAALSLYFARQKRWLSAGIASGLLALTKPYGFLILPVLFLEYLKDNGWDFKVLWKKINWLPLLLPVVSVIAYVIFNQVKFKQPLAFLIAERTWGRSFGNPLTSLLAEARDNLFTSGGILVGGHAPYLWYLFSFFFFICALIISWKRVRKTYLLFSVLVMLTALFSGTLTSWGRYMFLAFPVLMGPALYLSKRKYLAVAYFIVSGLALIIFASFFVRCYPFE